MFANFKTTTAVGAALAVIGALTAGAPSALASDRPLNGTAKPPAAISLGDSFISGEAGRWQGNGNDSLPGSRYGTDLAAYDCNIGETWCWHDAERVYGNSHDNGCHRSSSAEITHLENVRVGAETYAIDEADRLNIACSGATTEAIDQESFKSEPKQVDQLAAHAESLDIKLIVLSVGGNDIQFSDIIKECAAAFSAGSSTHCNQALKGALAGRIDGMKAAVTRSVEAIRSAMADAGYQTTDYRLVLQSYPSPIPRGADNRYPETDWSRVTTGGCPFYDDDSDWAVEEVVPGIAHAIESVAQETNADFLDLRNALNGHEVCAKGVDQAGEGNTLANSLPKAHSEWMRWIGAPGVGQGDVQEFMHPNFYGQQELGRCLNTLANGEESSFTCVPA
ncbi:GDSL-type esterase/lipase family protein [Actinophytocola sediminis]